MVNNGLVLLNVVGELRILEYKTRMRRTRREILRIPGKARPTSNDARLESINTPFRWSNKPSKGLQLLFGSFTPGNSESMLFIEGKFIPSEGFAIAVATFMVV
jgi:hypothetical protein